MKKQIRRRERIKEKRQKLIEKGERFSKKEMLLCYGLVLTCSILLGLGMQLKWCYLLAGVILCFLQVPGLYFHYKKSGYERQRFEEVNTYLSHMAQSFVGNGKLLQSLKETKNIFPKGEMYRLLTKAIQHIESAYDVALAQQEALDDIAREYDCERIRTLHDFLLKAESRGGSCEAEFKLLESIRQLWEKNALKYRNTLSAARNLVTFEYLLLVFVCMFMLYQFPGELNIMHLTVVQVLNTFLIVCFFLFFCRMDRKRSASLLLDRKFMSPQQAEEKLECIRCFCGKTAVIKQLPYAAAELTLTGIWVSQSHSSMVLIGGLVLFLIILGWQHEKYFFAVQSIKAEIKAVFPGWLFDVLLLMQSENVTVSLFKSIGHAPAVLQRELQQMKRELEEEPLSSEAFLSFLAEFRIPEVENTMRKLYALNMGKGGQQEVMNLIIDNNMTLLAEAEAQRLRFKGDLLSVYYMLPTVPVMICMIGYGVALMVVIFQNVMTVI